MKFNHVGIVTTEPKQGETYSPDMKLHLTDFSKSEHKIEWLRFDSDSQMPKEIMTHTHIAYEVDDLAAAIAGKQVILGPVDINESLSIAFIVDSEGCPIEYMQFKGQAAALEIPEASTLLPPPSP